MDPTWPRGEYRTSWRANRKQNRQSGKMAKWEILFTSISPSSATTSRPSQTLLRLYPDTLYPVCTLHIYQLQFLLVTTARTGVRRCRNSSRPALSAQPSYTYRSFLPRRFRAEYQLRHRRKGIPIMHSGGVNNEPGLPVEKLGLQL